MMEQDSWERTAHRTARVGQTGQGSQDSTAREDCQYNNDISQK
jgi:hypothetical protein